MHGPARGRIRPCYPRQSTGSDLAELASVVARLLIGGVGVVPGGTSATTFLACIQCHYAQTIATTIAYTSPGCIRVVSSQTPVAESSQPLMYLGSLVCC